MEAAELTPYVAGLIGTAGGTRLLVGAWRLNVRVVRILERAESIDVAVARHLGNGHGLPLRDRVANIESELGIKVDA